MHPLTQLIAPVQYRIFVEKCKGAILIKFKWESSESRTDGLYGHFRCRTSFRTRRFHSPAQPPWRASKNQAVCPWPQDLLGESQLEVPLGFCHRSSQHCLVLKFSELRDLCSLFFHCLFHFSLRNMSFKIFQVVFVIEGLVLLFHTLTRGFGNCRHFKPIVVSVQSKTRT